MENILTVRKRDEFFKFLESSGLDPVYNTAILEVAPNIITSQSILLMEKYGELYDQFLVTRRLGGKINGMKRYYHEKAASSTINSVDGMFGEVFVKDGNTCVFEYKNPCFINSSATLHRIYKGRYIPREYKDIAELAFNTLLIQGQPEEAYNLVTSELDLLFGDVCEIGNREVKRFYEDLLSTIRKYNPNGGSYSLVRDESKNRSNDAYLIKRMYR